MLPTARLATFRCRSFSSFWPLFWLTCGGPRGSADSHSAAAGPHVRSREGAHSRLELPHPPLALEPAEALALVKVLGALVVSVHFQFDSATARFPCHR